MTTNTIRWGIIGCGNVTEVKSGPALQKAHGSQLVAVMRRNGDLARDYAQRHGVPKWYNDADALINDPEVDAVYIATPPSSHKDYVLAVAQAGKPVYVEKPMARTYAECQAMIQACTQAGVPLFVAYYRRMLPRFLKVKAWLDAGAIGEVRSVNTVLHRPPSPEDCSDTKPWRLDPEIAGCGYFCDLGSHILDLLQYLLGPIELVTGYATNQGGCYEAEDTVSATWLFESGAHGTGTWHFSTQQRVDRTEIVGTTGVIHYATFDNEPVVLESRGQTESIYIENPQHIQQPLIQTIVDTLLGRGECPSTGQTAALTNRIIDTILRNPNLAKIR
ncbi:MAG: Gfo/Idh/MocA family oxidoreductase [Anaerolineae bacterium]|nr:Gfo/Idh/MocA family oxidoreductase [Anaerolineae bacterium]